MDKEGNSISTSPRPRRVRGLTEKAQTVYDEKVASYNSELASIRKQLEGSVLHIDRNAQNYTVLKEVKAIFE